MSLRLFTALPIPPEIIDHLTCLRIGVPGANWRHSNAMHLTLRFFGNVSDDTIEALDHELASIHFKPFNLIIKGVGHFGRNEPRALWAGIETAESLLLLAKSCERAARRAGLDIERRAYIPHVTLAYLGETPLDHVLEFERHRAAYQSPSWVADRFYLYSSWKGGRGEHPYRIEAEYPLN